MCRVFLLCLLVFVATTTEVSGTGTAAPVDRTLNLQEARITGKYRLVFERALNKFKLWLTSNHHGALSELAEDTIKFNDVLIDYLQHLYRDQAGVAAGRNCLLSVQNEFRHLKTAFHKAWDSIKSWEMIEPFPCANQSRTSLCRHWQFMDFFEGFWLASLQRPATGFRSPSGVSSAFMPCCDRASGGHLLPGRWQCQTGGSKVCPNMLSSPCSMPRTAGSLVGFR